MKRWLALLPIAVLAALGVFLMTQMDRMAGDPAAGPTYKPDALVGQPIPETTVLPILAGGKASDDLLDLKTAGVGKPMIVNLFASWCAPCRLEHPHLMTLKEQGIAVVGVAKGPDRDAGKEHFFMPGKPPFMLPLKSPVAQGRGVVALEVYDPTYFVSFSLADGPDAALARRDAGPRDAGARHSGGGRLRQLP